jgi:hypothetical protein
MFLFPASYLTTSNSVTYIESSNSGLTPLIQTVILKALNSKITSQESEDQVSSNND